MLFDFIFATFGVNKVKCGLVLGPKEHIEYWLKSAAHDLESAETLFENKRYDWCLFLGHLVIEKMLKAFCVREYPNRQVPFTHNLAMLAERTKLVLTQEQRTLLLEINQFNIKGRYPDYKFEFYRYNRVH